MKQYVRSDRRAWRRHSRYRIGRGGWTHGHWLWPWRVIARGHTVVSCPSPQVVAAHGTPDRRSGCRLARADGGSGVVADVVETPWTGGASRDAVRHRGAVSSADAGLPRLSESLWTGTGLLMTQRSRVQIPPPLLISAGQGPFPAGGGPLRF